MEDFREEQDKAGLVFSIDGDDASPPSSGGYSNLITPILRSYLDYREKRALNAIKEEEDEEKEKEMLREKEKEEEKKKIQIKVGEEMAELHHLLNGIEDLRKNYMWTGKSSQVTSKRVSRALSTFNRLEGSLRLSMDRMNDRQLDAAMKIQGLWRVRKSRIRLQKLVGSIYKKYYDPASKRHYYMSTRDRRVTWTRPGALNLIGSAEDRPETDAPPTRKRSSDHVWTEEEAARCVQDLFRRKRARERLLAAVKQVHKRYYDKTSGRYYYYNTKTGKVSWQAPNLLSKLKRDLSVANDIATTKVERKRSIDHTWTNEEAARCVQNLYRRKKARNALMLAIKSVHKRFYDASSGRYYYHNAKTGEVSWQAPKLLSKLQ